MANKSKRVDVENRNNKLTVQEHETDSPIIPVAHLERLHKFKPDAVDWVIKQTEIEATYRRTEGHRVNRFVFIHHLFGQICALLIGLAGIGCGSWVALSGQPVAGGVIASLAITGLAAVFLTGTSKK